MRKITKLENKFLGAPTFILKTVEIGRKIPICDSIEDLNFIKKNLTSQEYFELYQQFKEWELYNKMSWQERQFLAPIVDFYYDKNNCPVIVCPYFVPFASEREALLIEDDAVIEVLEKKASNLGIAEEKLGIVLDNLSDICYLNDLSDADMLLNLSNIGYSPYFGIRSINYGITNELKEELKNNCKCEETV